jgi:choline monooxygenase
VYGRGIVFQRIEPIKPSWCRVVYNLFRPSSVSFDDFESNEGKYQLDVTLEDQQLVPEIQRNLQAGIYQSGPLSAKYESGVTHFHQLLMKKITKGE